ncbi:hypothetical protein HYZ97_02075 [Candidatus Pacearchaeota archaeon]|nr:hypothetical protein [Candidatus Pacearchaeota archaeon]
MRLLEIGKNLTSYWHPGLSTVRGPMFTPYEREHFITDSSIPVSCLIGLAFGNERTYATQQLSHTLIGAREYYLCNHAQQPMPVIAQWALLKDKSIKEYDWSIDTRTRGSAPEERPLNSHEALEIARDIIKRELGTSLEEIAFVAHPAQMQRVLWLAQKMGMKGTPFMPAHPVWNAGQESTGAGNTVSPEKWRFYELKVRCHHNLKGWI